MSIDIGWFIPIIFWLWAALLFTLFVVVSVWVMWVAVKYWRNR